MAKMNQRYSRVIAINNGFLVDVSKMGKEAGYKCQVAMTETVYQKCVAVPSDQKEEHEENVRLWIVLWNSRFKKLILGSNCTF